MKKLQDAIASVKTEAGLDGLSSEERKVLRGLWDDNGTKNVLLGLASVIDTVKHTKFVGDKDFAKESDRQIAVIKKAINDIG